MKIEDFKILHGLVMDQPDTDYGHRTRQTIVNLLKDHDKMLGALKYVHTWCLQDDGEINSDYIKQVLDEIGQ